LDGIVFGPQVETTPEKLVRKFQPKAPSVNTLTSLTVKAANTLFWVGTVPSARLKVDTQPPPCGLCKNISFPESIRLGSSLRVKVAMTTSTKCCGAACLDPEIKIEEERRYGRYLLAPKT
jgi:hypothetical protein